MKNAQVDESLIHHPVIRICVHRCAIVGVLRPGRKGKKVAAVKSFLMGFFAFLPIECALAGDFSKR